MEPIIIEMDSECLPVRFILSDKVFQLPQNINVMSRIIRLIINSKSFAPKEKQREG